MKYVFVVVCPPSVMINKFSEYFIMLDSIVAEAMFMFTLSCKVKSKATSFLDTNKTLSVRVLNPKNTIVFPPHKTGHFLGVFVYVSEVSNVRKVLAVQVVPDMEIY